MKKISSWISVVSIYIVIVSCSNFNSISKDERYLEDSLATIVKTEAIVNELLETARQKYVEALTEQSQ